MDKKPRNRRAARSTHWGDAVRQRRLLLGVTQEDLSQMSGLGVNFVKEVERGETHLRLDKLLDLLKFLGLDLQVLPRVQSLAHEEQGALSQEADFQRQDKQ